MQKNKMIKKLAPRSEELRAMHLQNTKPSPWVSRFVPLIKQGGLALDLAAGNGRHGRLLLNKHCRVIFIDQNTKALRDLEDAKNIKIITANLEDGDDPFKKLQALSGQLFDAIIVVNYLYRPLMNSLIDALAPGGIIIYETFARGNENFARPRNPDHLLRNGELLEYFSKTLQIVSYEHGQLDTADIPGVKQRVCAIKDLQMSNRLDGEPKSHALYP